jgi:hypothetical protein
MKRVLKSTLLILIICFLLAVKVYATDPVFERIKQSLPQREAGWKVIAADGPYQSSDGSLQAHFRWASGAEEVGATVVLYKSLKTAKDQFKRPRKAEPSMDAFLIAGLGDEAYLFPPIILHQEGPFNLRMRKARYEICMSARSKDIVTRCARYILDAIF